MRTRPNTTIAVLRGITYTQDGDEAEADTEIISGEPALVIEISRTTQTESSQNPRTVRSHRMTVGTRVDIQPGDRILDERRGELFSVESAEQPTYTGGDQRVWMSRVN